MRYSKLGVLLMNTGTVDEPTVEATRAYLGEFLMDPAIIGAPWPVRKLLVRHICKHRPQRTVESYRAFWTEEGSPFMVESLRQRDKLAASLARRTESDARVALAMRYGNPSISSGLAQLRGAGCDFVVLLPSYPQQVSVCAGTCLKAAHEALAAMRAEGWDVRSADVLSFYEQPAYRDALVERVRAAWERRPGSKLLVSFHSTLMADIEAGDPYRDQAQRTRDFLAEGLGIPEGDAVVCYQSRFDSRRWLGPFTESVLLDLAAAGVKDVCTVCPIFTAPNVETVIEVGRDLRRVFLDAAGPGASFTHVPELGAADGLIEAMAQAVEDALSGKTGEAELPKLGNDQHMPGMLGGGCRGSREGA